MQYENAGHIVLIRCNKIISSDKRKTDDKISILSNNIRKNGIIQPLTVRPLDYGMYEIISGERRFTASKLAGLSSVPCIIIDADEKTSAALNFIENSFRKNYSLFDEADKIKSLILDYKYDISAISDMLSCDISEIIDKLKILHFSRENRIKAENANLSFRQCKALLKLENTEFFDKTIDEIISFHLNDFQTEEYISKILKNKRNTVIFKDIRIFTNTVTNAVEKMKSAGINVISDKSENDEKIEYRIVIIKNNKFAVKSR